MRDLTKKQKRLLDIWYNEQKEKGKVISLFWKVNEDDDFSGELFEEIDNINPCEMIYQNINNYITSKD